MPSSQRKEFSARFLLATNDETGEEFVLQSDAEINQSLEIARADFEQKMDEYSLSGMSEESVSKMRTTFETQQTALKNRLVRDRDAAKSGAEEFSFTLVKPDYGQFLRIRAEANVFDDRTGAATFDEALYCDLLLKNDGVKRDGGVVVTASEIDALAPRVAAEIGMRLANSMEPNRKRLPFTSRR